jgi:PTH1 family peptidyl-tRNA hydrolase
MKIVVGLGNPGIEYQRTRHNVGFDCVDRLARRICEASHTPRARFQALASEGNVGGEKVLLLKPMTYMNLSGTSVVEALRFYKLDATRDLLVIVDDIALPCGAIRLRTEGSAGGHNGLSDIESRLGTHRYARCRIGVDAPGRIPQRDYVLGRFREDQQPLVDEAIGLACDAAACWVTRGITEAMNRFNRRADDASAKQPKAPPQPPSPSSATKPDVDANPANSTIHQPRCETRSNQIGNNNV